MLNTVFPDRTLYLFDTFEGFDAEEIQDEVRAGKIDRFFSDQQRFDDTSVQNVQKNLPHPEMVRICKGLFEETCHTVDDRFVFVSLDMDLEKPMSAALEYFYPRLQPGGYIFMHDYNHSMIRGVRDVIRTYEDTHGELPKFPLCDEGGTIVLMKVGS